MNAFKYGPVSALASEMIENLYEENLFGPTLDTLDLFTLPFM